MQKLLCVAAMIGSALVLRAVAGIHARDPAPAMSAAPAVRENPAPHPAPEQPLPYSHKTHVRLGLQCVFCHANPAPGNQMTFPATSTCMTCHSTAVTDRPAIKKLAEYANSDQPIPWVRVYKVLPGVTWTHRKHLEAGVKCETCHGAVSDLQVMSETTSVTAMASCIGCHESRRVSAACTVCHAWPAK
jgi:hypothetical protein